MCWTGAWETVCVLLEYYEWFLGSSTAHGRHMIHSDRGPCGTLEKHLPSHTQLEARSVECKNEMIGLVKHTY